VSSRWCLATSWRPWMRHSSPRGWPTSWWTRAHPLPLVSNRLEQGGARQQSAKTGCLDGRGRPAGVPSPAPLSHRATSGSTPSRLGRWRVPASVTFPMLDRGREFPTVVRPPIPGPPFPCRFSSAVHKSPREDSHLRALRYSREPRVIGDHLPLNGNVLPPTTGCPASTSPTLRPWKSRS